MPAVTAVMTLDAFIRRVLTQRIVTIVCKKAEISKSCRNLWFESTARSHVCNNNCFITDILIRPVVSYGAEKWTMTKKEEQAMLVFERKIFRTIYGLKYKMGNEKLGQTENWKR